MNKPSRIIVFGLCGSGKSTVADMISARYGLRVIHPSGILRDLLERKQIDMNTTKAGRGFWESKQGIDLFKARQDEKKSMDVVCDKLLLKELSKGNVVMDSWTMPWLYKKKAIRIYLKCTLNERITRVAKRGNLDIKHTKHAVTTKDSESQKIFKKLYDFDIKKDLDVFDITINTTHINREQVFQKVTEFLDAQ